MAFENKNMAVIAYADGFTMWHYKTTDLLIDITKPGYFNDILKISNTGDVVIINAFDGTFIASFVQESERVILARVQI